MLSELSVSQFDNWWWYSQKEPFGYPLHDHSQAQITSAVYNATGAFNPFITPQECLLVEQQQPQNTAVDWQTLKEKFRSG